MEQQHNLNYLSVCHSCLRRESGIIKSRKSHTLGQLLVCALALTICMFKVAAAETLCGGELVDALQFVCEDRGFYFSRPISRSNSRRVQNRGIVEECCFRSCDLALLEQYCAKPAKSERDVSATSLQVPVNPAIKTEVPRKHVTVKYSKYGLWQQNAAQRLRRGVPSVLLSKKHRRHTEKNKAREQKNAHKRLITPPTKLPPVWHSTETYISRN